MGFDVHRIGTYLVTSPADNRLPYRFDWSWPKMTAGYRAHLQAGLKPETYADAMWELSRHTLTVGWYDLDTADLVAAINEAVLAITPTKRWYVTAAGTSETYSCLIRDVEHSEAYSVDVDGRRGTAIDFILTCTAGWEAEETEVTLTPASVPDGPVVHTASGLLGSMPAPFRLALTNDQAVTGGTFGFRHSPATGFDPIQDYQGTVDATALGGEYAGATMDADGTQVGTPETLDTNAMRGWYYACARVIQPDTPADTTYWARSTVTGSGMSGTQSAESDAVAASVANAWEHVRLGPVPVPGGAVPGIETGTGYSAESAEVTQNAGTSLWDQSLVGSVDELQSFGRTFVWSGALLTRIAPKLKNTGTAAMDVTLAIYETVDDLFIGSQIASKTVSVAAGFNGTVSFTFDIALSSGTYAYAVSGDWTKLQHYYNADSAEHGIVAYGTWYDQEGPHTEWNYDILGNPYFAVYGKSPLGFTATVAIIAANSGGGTGGIDVVALVPADEFAALFDTPHGAAEGLMLDAMDPDEVTAYGTNTSGGIEPADQAKVEYVGIPRIWPGVTAIVYDAHTPANAAPLAGDAKLWYRPTYRTPYGA